MYRFTALSRDQAMSLGFFFVLPLFFLIFKHYFKSTSSPKRPPLPPGPKPWPIVGNILQMGTKPHISMTQFAKLHGPLISLRLGTQLLVIGSSPEAAAEILRTHDRLLSARYILKIMFAGGVDLNRVSLMWAPQCNERWKVLRSLCKAELFSPKAIESQTLLREKKMVEMVEFLGSREGQVVKVKQVVSATAFNVLANLVFSKDLTRFEDGECDGTNNGLKGILERLTDLGTRPNLADFFPILGNLDIHGIYKHSIVYLKQAYAEWEDLIKDRRRARGQDPSSKQRDFLDAMIENEFADDQINHLIIELFTAGIDTTTTTVEWAMAELVKNKEAMNKVVEELRTKETPFSEQVISQLPYLNACFKETLRLHPPAPFLLPHFAPETCEVMNYTVPKNSRVFVNVWAIGRDPTFWEDPLLFKPDRFLGSNLEFKGHDFEFLPFGSGRRICPGLMMGSKQVLLIMANLVRFFDWSLPNNDDPGDLDMGERLGITMQKEQPLLLIPKIKN